MRRIPPFRGGGGGTERTLDYLRLARSRRSEDAVTLRSAAVAWVVCPRERKGPADSSHWLGYQEEEEE